MDDLNGLDWSSTTKSTSKAPTGTGNYYPTLRPTPPPQLSGRNTPLSAQSSGAPKPFAPPKTATPDSFSNLVSFGSSKNPTLTLQEQQEKLQAQKNKQEEEKRKQYESQFGGGEFWDGLGNQGSGSVATPPVISRGAKPSNKPFSPGLASPPINGSGANAADDDLFAAFNADTKVDNSSFYPPPSIPSSGKSTPGFGARTVGDLSKPQAWEQPSGSLGADLGDDDDPFGLGQMKAQKSTPAPIATADDDDFLGDLGKPVEEVRRKSPAVPEPAHQGSPEESDDPWDKAVAELVDMGFSAEQSRRALTESGSGLDIQAAVGWILNDAHRQAKAKQQTREPSRTESSNGERREMPRDGARRENKLAWMREEGRDRSQPRRDDSRSPASGEADLSKAAAAVGSNLFKTANSIWKTSQKKVQKTVAEFQQEADPSQPKWMREAAEREQEERRAAAEGRSHPKPGVPEVTDEALMLEGGGRPPPRKMKAPEPRFPPSNSSSRDQSPAIPKPPSEGLTPTPRWQQTAPADPRSRINKQAVEEQSAQAYVSPARRKKATSQPQPIPEVDLFSPAPPQSKPAQSRPTPTQLSSRPTPRATPVPSKPSTPIPTRPRAPPRNIPPLSNIALQSSTQNRLAGTNHFKRGDYASAHQSYTSSLSALPQSHPITIILLCNRALTALKTGVPREAASDADTALALIGPSRGDEETIDLGPGEGGGKKEMKEFWGKALMRKAEALEQMEKWREAGEVWKQCVEGGVGSATAIQGRTRCEKALAPKPASTTRPVASRPRPKPKPALSDLGPQAPDSAAVERLREANKAAERADDEKFALADKVDARISQWRDGKRDNLRALIGSLDLVMWQESEWRKVGMHELVTNGKVKINYMKAIGKCHPDKLPQEASTETKLIAATVFSTLNESWDKFKAQNGM